MSQPSVHKMRLPTGAKKEIQRVLADGWTLAKGGKHYKLRPPEGHAGLIVLSTSSSDSDIEHIVRHSIRKLEATWKSA